MAATDPAARRNKLDGEKVTLAQRALTVLFGDNPAGAERLAFGVLFFIPECLPDLADLSDAELRAGPAADDPAHAAGLIPITAAGRPRPLVTMRGLAVKVIVGAQCQQGRQAGSISRRLRP